MTKLEELTAVHSDEDIAKAFIAVMGEDYATAEGLEEDYAGQFPSDEAFAQDLAENLGDIPSAGSAPWPLYCIDWEYAAREIMMDYTEQDGYYFRQI